MTVYLILSLALPPVAAFLAPALVAWKPGWKAATAGHGALCGTVTLVGIIAGAPIGTLLAVVAFATAFAALAVGTHLAFGQIASGVIVVLLISTLFVARPALGDAIDRGDMDAFRARLSLVLSINPYPTMAASIFDIDVLRRGSLYALHYADYAAPAYPRWGFTALGYVLAGAALGGVGVVVRRRKTA